MADKFEFKVPQLKLERDFLRGKLRGFAEASGLIAPLSLDELKSAVEEFLQGENSEYATYRDWLCVILNNEVWRGEFEKIPHSLRVLILPQCLRNRKSCKASFDKFGLLCAMCGGLYRDILTSFRRSFLSAFRPDPGQKYCRFPADGKCVRGKRNPPKGKPASPFHLPSGFLASKNHQIVPVLPSPLHPIPSAQQFSQLPFI